MAKETNNSVTNEVENANNTVDSTTLTAEQEAQVNEAMSAIDGEGPTDLRQPVVEGETLVFEMKNGDLKTVADKGEYSGRKYSFLISDNGKQVTLNQLVRRRGNGFVIDGNTPKERWKNILTQLVLGKKISVRCKKISIQKSTNPDFNDSKIFTWEMA